ncbi:hypothetical protein [Sphingobacterium bambusae]|uniref:Uncharacterized protein n=1 Tax=Sphingobacterium bambusae TaxID=662858 RepID=A0ABW6BK27_9SPHI|nr:hypothetical protein [Sphingobacterium bambusae]WPL49310.1 hypothetical protein SCB77_02425 [Sphingobacterium bambusae]
METFVQLKTLVQVDSFRFQKPTNAKSETVDINFTEIAIMNNPARRNRNIGTVKRGFGQNNKLTIPEPCGVLQSFYERLTDYYKIKSVINGHDFLFVIEQTRADSQHPCSVIDIETIIEQIPKEDYGELKLIVLRQPKRKEEILSPTWED